MTEEVLMIKILISACLMGEKVRYDGGGKQILHPLLHRWLEEGRLVPICPEVAGGLPVPRPPAEISGDGGDSVLRDKALVKTREGKDVTRAFLAGAQAALELARVSGCSLAILKARSPSCGSKNIYDGSFSGSLKAGVGVTAALLQAHGIAVFSEEDLHQVQLWLDQQET